MLIMICGLPATGKTTLAKALSEKLGAVHVSSDTVRMSMLEEREYTKEEKRMVYRAMFEKAEKNLKEGKNVVLDATFYKKELRENAEAVAEKAKTGFFIVECVTHEELLKERIFKRKKEETESEADFEVYRKVKVQFEPIEEEHLAVDTSLSLEKQVELVEKYIGR
jgi:predicted kinase